MSRLLNLLVGLMLLFTVVGGLAASDVYAQEQPPKPPEPNLELETKFPVVSAESGGAYEFEVTVRYTGAGRKRFDLVVSAPQDWVALSMSSYPEKQVAAIELGPAEGFPVSENIKVRASPVFWKLPDPGEYPINLTVSSGALKQSMELKAKVTARYEFSMKTESGKLNTETTAGTDTHVTIKLVNSGSAAIDNITFTSTKPEGWTINFKPDKVDSLASGITQDVDVTINAPSGKTIAGDYMINLKADSKKISSSLDLRVTVLTSTIWGWVGIIIVLVVIVGLAVLFRQLGRR